jgi:hypothetical protein
MMRTEQEARLYRLNRENFARRIAAKKLGVDEPWGRKLTDEQWRQAIPQAERWLQFETTSEERGYGHVTVQGTCPPDTTVKEVEERFYHWYFGGRNAWVKDGQFGCTIHTD